MNSLSLFCYRVAILILIVGVVWGIAMAATTRFELAAAHAHLNLLGWVTLALFGVFYQFNPALAATRLARIQIGLHIVGVVVMIVALSMLLQGNTSFEPVVAIGSFLILADLLAFAYLTLKARAIA